MAIVIEDSSTVKRREEVARFTGDLKQKGWGKIHTRRSLGGVLLDVSEGIVTEQHSHVLVSGSMDFKKRAQDWEGEGEVIVWDHSVIRDIVNQHTTAIFSPHLDFSQPSTKIAKSEEGVLKETKDFKPVIIPFEKG